MTDRDIAAEGTAEENNPSVRMDPFEKPYGGMVRFVMSRDLNGLPNDQPLPFGYRIEPWCRPMMPAFAAATAISFSDSPDIELYPKLGSREGCLNVVEEIVSMPDFLQGISWLVFFSREPCAFILTGQAKKNEVAQIRLVGVAPHHRRIGVGTQLIDRALWAFHDSKFKQAVAKSPRTNRSAIRFFRSTGFHVVESHEYL